MNHNINTRVEFRDLGLMDYQQAWDYQTELFDVAVQRKIANRKLNNPEAEDLTDNYLLFVEHPHVYTLGKSGDPANLLLDDEGLRRVNATYYHINRGGDITYHGPGQLVVYPVLDLDNFFTDIHRYMRCLEEAVIRTCAHYGLHTGRIEGLTGVWMDHEEQKDPRKICALGVKTSRWVTMHGLAFNVNAHLDYFGHIIPCGIDDKAVTSLEKELGHPLPMEEVKALMKRHLTELFEMELFESTK